MLSVKLSVSHVLCCFRACATWMMSLRPSQRLQQPLKLPATRTKPCINCKPSFNSTVQPAGSLQTMYASHAYVALKARDDQRTRSLQGQMWPLNSAPRARPRPRARDQDDPRIYAACAAPLPRPPSNVAAG